MRSIALHLAGGVALSALALVSVGGCRQILGIEDPVPCDTDESCSPGATQPCTLGECVQGECVYSPRPDGPIEGCALCEGGLVVPFEEEGDPCYTGPAGTEGQGVCAPGVWTCSGEGAPACDGEVLPGQETCGGEGVGVDEDCDGATDSGGLGCDCVLGESISCYEGPANTEGHGICASGTASCEATRDGFAIGECTGAIEPQEFDSCVTAADENCDDESPACGCEHQFSVSFGGTGSDKSVAVGVEADGSLLLFAETNSPTLTVGADTLTNAGGTDTVLVRFDPRGNPISAGLYGGTGSDNAIDLAVVDDGIWIAGNLGNGSAEDFGGGATLTAVGVDGYLVKLDSDFNPISKRKIGGNQSDRIRAMAKGPDGGVAIVGEFMGSVDFGGEENLVSVGAEPNLFIARYASDGTHMWSRSFGGGDTEYLGGVAIAANGEVIVAGYSNIALDAGGGPLLVDYVDPFVARYDAQGNHIYSRTFNGPGFDTVNGVVILSDGSSWVTGSFQSELDLDGVPGSEITKQGEQSDYFLAKLDPTGGYLDSVTFDSEAPFAGVFESTRVGPDDAIYVSMVAVGTLTLDVTYTAVSFDAFYAKLTPDGEVVCSKQIGSDQIDFAGNVSVDPLGNIFATGSVRTATVDLGGGPLPNQGDADMFVVKYRQ